MNTKYNTTDEATCERESEISREMLRLEQSIEVLNHRIANALTKKLLPVTRQEAKPKKEPQPTDPSCFTPLGIRIQNTTSSVDSISEIVEEILLTIEL
jgi:hypothetical protein